MGHALHPRFAFLADLRRMPCYSRDSDGRRIVESTGRVGLLLFVHREVVFFHLCADAIECVIHIV